MKKIAFVFMLIVLLISGACQVPQTQQPTPELTAKSLQQKTVALVMEQDDELYVYCTGVWISNVSIITAAHCVVDEGDEDEPKPYVSPVGQQVQYLVTYDVDVDMSPNVTVGRKATVKAVDIVNDLALLRASDENMPLGHPVATLQRSNSVDVGSEVHIVGHTVGLWWTYTKGVIANHRVASVPSIFVTKDTHVFQISAPVWFGNSGGGAFDRYENLIGISSFVRTRGPNICFFIHHDLIWDFVQKSGG